MKKQKYPLVGLSLFFFTVCVTASPKPENQQCRLSLMASDQKLKSLYTHSKEDRFASQVEMVIKDLDKLEEDFYKGMELGKSPESYVRRSNNIVKNVAKLFEQMGEKVEVVEDQIDFQVSPFVIKQEELILTYKRISLGEIEAESRSSLNLIGRFAKRFDVQELSIDPFRNMVLSYGGFFLAKDSLLSLGSKSIHRLLEWDSIGMVSFHEFYHASAQSSRVKKAEIAVPVEVEQGLALQNLKTASEGGQIQPHDFSKHADNLTTSNQVLLENHKNIPRVKSRQTFDIRFFARGANYIPDALYKKFMSAEELYTFANNLWWSLKSNSPNFSKKSGADLKDLWDHWEGLIYSLENVARQTQVASEMMIQRIDHLLASKDLNLYEQQIGVSPSERAFYFGFNVEGTETHYTISNYADNLDALANLFSLYEDRWEAVDLSPRSNSKNLSVLRVNSSKSSEKAALIKTLESYLLDMRSSLVELERAGAFYVIEALDFYGNLAGLKKLMTEAGSFSEEQLSLRTLAYLRVLKIESRRLGSWIRPGYRNYVGTREETVDRERLQKHYDFLKSSFEKKNSEGSSSEIPPTGN